MRQNPVPTDPQPDGGADTRVRLLDLEPDLAGGLTGDELAAARTQLVVPTLEVGTGRGGIGPLRPDAVAAMVSDGLLVCDAHLFGRPTTQLFGVGDVLDPATLDDAGAQWRALLPARLIVLDERFVLAARRWPQIFHAFTSRLLHCQQDLQLRAAIVAMPRVEERVLALLAHLALRWGHVTPQGLALDLPITHLLLGRLVGARRPTISLALATLRDQGLLDRDAAGRWVLPSAAADWPTDGVPDVRADGQVRALRVSR